MNAPLSTTTAEYQPKNHFIRTNRYLSNGKSCLSHGRIIIIHNSLWTQSSFYTFDANVNPGNIYPVFSNGLHSVQMHRTGYILRIVIQVFDLNRLIYTLMDRIRTKYAKYFCKIMTLLTKNRNVFIFRSFVWTLCMHINRLHVDFWAQCWMLWIFCNKKIFFLPFLCWLFFFSCFKERRETEMLFTFYSSFVVVVHRSTS